MDEGQERDLRAHQTAGGHGRAAGERHGDGNLPHTRSRRQALAPALALSSASSPTASSASASSSDSGDADGQQGQLWHSSQSDPPARQEPHGGLPEEGAPSEAHSSWFRRLPSLHRVTSSPPCFPSPLLTRLPHLSFFPPLLCRWLPPTLAAELLSTRPSHRLDATHARDPVIAASTAGCQLRGVHGQQRAQSKMHTGVRPKQDALRAARHGSWLSRTGRCRMLSWHTKTACLATRHLSRRVARTRSRAHFCGTHR